jgi:DNA-binding beta-propeller fold protein YncE
MFFSACGGIFDVKPKLLFQGILLGLISGLLASCASPPAPSALAPRVWPAPPDEARIAFVGCLRGPRDVGSTPSPLRSFANWITGDTVENLNLQKPFAVALDESGNLCVTDTDARMVCYADFARKKWVRYAGAGKTKFACPVAVARRHGIFYVADSELAKVLAFDAAGKPAFEIAAPLQRPVGLAIAGDSLFVVDALAHCVFVFGLDGKFRSVIGRRGDGAGEFNFPTCAATDNGGRLIVSDTMNSRVQVFDAKGNFISQFGGNGDTSGHFSRPKGVSADVAGRIYVVDGLFDNFQIFDGAGRLLLNVGESGVDAGQFALPNGIAIGADGRIFVADAFNHRVQIFKYVGSP